MEKSKQEVPKAVSLIKMAENLRSVSSLHIVNESQNLQNTTRAMIEKWFIDQLSNYCSNMCQTVCIIAMQCLA